MWKKHRDAVEVYSFDFQNALEIGETITSYAVKVFLKDGLTWDDVSTDFVEGAPSLTGSIVSWKAKDGTPTTQLPDTPYRARVEAVTSELRKIIHTELFTITAEASDA